MNSGRTVFSQLISFLPDREFRRCVARYGGDRRLREFSCWDQYLTMAFAQLTYRESLRDIEACLRSLQGKLYHLGFRGHVSRSTLADANENRDWRIFADFAQVLIGIARPLYAHDPMGVDLEQSLYALDSTTIDLCLSLFPWARFRKHKAAVKMHTLLDLHGNIPTFIRISDGKLHDVNVLDDIPIEAGAFYVIDRGYLDFARLYRLTMCAAFFVTSTKDQGVLWHQRECREDPNRDRGLDLPAGRHRPQAPGTGSQSLPNSTGPQHHPLRENAHFAGTSSMQLPRRLTRSWQPIDSIRLLTG